jgi:RNA polymerase sigma-70 factor, ECF subfamily
MASVRDSGFFEVGQVAEAAEEHHLADAELVADLVMSNPVAWRTFRARFDRLIYRCIGKVMRRFARVVSEDDTQEIYSNVYLALVANDMHKLRSWSPALGSRLSTWLGMIAIHAAYDYLRSLRREPRKEEMSAALGLACESPDPFEMAVDVERAALTSRTLEGFSERDRTFAELYFGEGMTPDEIAQEMNISVKTVYTKKHKIQARLESVLAANERAARAA